MNLEELLTHLDEQSKKTLTLHLPDGSFAPPHFHITEVGHLTRNFIDCGGTRHSIQTCLLQTWVAHDYNHRLQNEKLAKIIRLAAEEFPTTELPVEIEHEAPVLTQLTIASAEADQESLHLHLAYKNTDCLAKDICLPPDDFSLPPIPTLNSKFS